MTKLTKTNGKAKAMEPGPVSSQSTGPKDVAFSVRLTADEHELLKQAAAARGWTPTNLIRTATLERAKHILNTSRVTTFNFKGLAVKLAEQLFKERTYDVVRSPYDDSNLQRTVRVTAAGLRYLAPNEETGDDDIAVSVTPNIEEFSTDDFHDFKMAVRYGGGEFLNQVLEYCEGLTASKRSDVPPLIDPLSPSV